MGTSGVVMGGSGGGRGVSGRMRRKQEGQSELQNCLTPRATSVRPCPPGQCEAMWKDMSNMQQNVQVGRCSPTPD